MIPLLDNLFRRTFDLTDNPENDIPTAVGNPRSRIVLNVPVTLLVMHGAFRYSGGWHPFVAALSNGPEALTSYYQRVHPRCFEEF